MAEKKKGKTLIRAKMPDGTPIKLQDWSGIYFPTDYLIRATPKLVKKTQYFDVGHPVLVLLCTDNKEEALEVFDGLKSGTTSLKDYPDMVLGTSYLDYI